MKIKLTVILLCAIPAFISAQTVAMDTFTAAQPDMYQLMPGMTDVLRSALSSTGRIVLTVNRSAAEYVVTGTVTRINQGRYGQFSGNNASQLFDSVSMITDNANSDEMEVNPGVIISAQVINIRSGNIISSRTIQAYTWEEYLRKAAAMAASLVNPIPVPPPTAPVTVTPAPVITPAPTTAPAASTPAPAASVPAPAASTPAPAASTPAPAASVAPSTPLDALAGTWEVTLNHGNFEDTYRLVISGTGSCTVTVTSVQGSTRRTQTADGNYTYQDDILNLTVRFNNNTVSHISRIEWRATVSMASNRRSFNAIVPVSNASGATRVRGTFYKQ